eukprot:TRINITY_DN58445_c0_g1_i2.p1 TRINITY_DN58445_c0_g1~~TRINITY_DN58445_c0_g1_i2.p1  ORF type:complete len:136 (+),score=28.78 TRINITY_DN58445_c0_g1_i2:149-556(+)
MLRSLVGSEMCIRDRVSSVCSVLHADDMIYFEAIKSSPGLLGYYLEAKDRGGFLAKTASQVPWGRAICASRPVSLYLESLHHILLHKNLPESVLVRGIMPLRRDLSLIHISEPTRLLSISYAVFCLKKKTKIKRW